MLKGKTAIVTGSTSGIGLGIARKLAAAGADIMLNGFGDAAEIEAERQAIEADFGVKALYSAADMSKPDQIAAMVASAEQAFGTVDILVNNAGIQHTALVENFPAERWETIIAINLSAVFYGTQAVLPGMKARNWGRIINIASAHGLVASAQKAAYVAAKHGVVGLTKVVALETAESGITCNAICPGWVLTPLVQKQIDALAARENITVAEAQVKLLSEKQPSRQFTTPDQLGDLAVFLCSEAAGNIKGASLPVDGGWTAQ
ncbi:MULTISPECIES: 3-hydroxybutyrate dehydrogenase [unclassified Azospirillum]|uniref:3-hydroxybutyrate dehydrogenase n=1 Tax=unclassified Azospirillum TaxID=2630922 RepID=UPI000B634206|nr:MULTISPECIES: 3-hydroxybutyrate dehydrogenase [unclassified Azospirillum]SNR96975.1 3-hydroxybutyrate dehydrogenase [Azospirillum sp. RU38E]SNS14055.1 3-hydroxybutyrate dehydrogenase [Azospirillum sp. RU37A]